MPGNNMIPGLGKNRSGKTCVVQPFPHECPHYLTGYKSQVKAYQQTGAAPVSKHG